MIESYVIQRPDTAAIESSLVPIVREAEDLTVTDAASHAEALLIGKRAAAAKAQFEALLASSISAAHAAHRELTALRSKLTEPCERAMSIVGSKAIAWKRQAEAAARAKEERLRAEALAAEQARQLDDAIAAEESGDADSVDAILDETPTVPVVHVAPDVGHVAGASVRGTWKARVTDVEALIRHVAANPECVSFLVPAMPVLNAMARSQKSALRIPGVEAVREESVSFARR